MEGNLCFKIDWASYIFGRKFTVFVLLYFVFEGNFPGTSPLRGLYLEGRFNGGIFALLGWGACIWRGLYMEGLIFGILWYAKKEKSLSSSGNNFSYLKGHVFFQTFILKGHT